MSPHTRSRQILRCIAPPHPGTSPLDGSLATPIQATTLGPHHPNSSSIPPAAVTMATHPSDKPIPGRLIIVLVALSSVAPRDEVGEDCSRLHLSFARSTL